MTNASGIHGGDLRQGNKTRGKTVRMADEWARGRASQLQGGQWWEPIIVKVA